jgi:hypothetical protein
MYGFKRLPAAGHGHGHGHGVFITKRTIFVFKMLEIKKLLYTAVHHPGFRLLKSVAPFRA